MTDSDDVHRCIEHGYQGERPLPLPTSMMRPQVTPVANHAPGSTPPAPPPVAEEPRE
jgi:hypothetical protein